MCVDGEKGWPRLPAALVAMLVLGVGYLAGSLPSAAQDRRSEASPAVTGTPTTEQRLKTLEGQTDFYKKAVKKISRTYKKAKVAGSIPWDCSANKMSLTVDPEIDMGGTSYAWASATIKYQGVPASDRMIDFLYWIADKPTICSTSGSLPASGGKLAFKKYCSFAVEPGDKYQFSID